MKKSNFIIVTASLLLLGFGIFLILWSQNVEYSDGCLNPLMDHVEYSLFEKYSKSNISQYLEWGIGGSTAHFGINAHSNIYAIDSYQQWCDKVTKDLCVRQHQEKIEIYCVQPDENTKIVSYGNPEPISREGLDFDEQLFYYNYGTQYVKKSINELGIKPESMDFIFVDGRYRVACALYAYNLLADDGFLAIHDYTIRPNYHVIELYYDQLEIGGSGVVFKKKLNALQTTKEQEEYSALLEKYLAIKD